MSKTRALALLLPAILALAACSRPGGTPSSAGAPTPAAPPTAVTGVGVVADVNGTPILAAELEQKVAGRLVRVRQEEYELRRQALDELIAGAPRRGRGREAQGHARGAGASGGGCEVRHPAPGPDRDRLRAEQGALRRADPGGGARPHPRGAGRAGEGGAPRRLGEGAARRRAVAVRLEAPRATVAIPAGAPSTGPVNAPVTIVEFTDYQCPYCHRAQSVIDQVLSRYAGKIRFVHLDFPLDGHPGAIPAARAARCAGEQGKFWEYHRGLMTAPGRSTPPTRAARRHPRAGRLLLRRVPLVGPPRRRDPGVGPAGRGAGRQRHPCLLRQRPDALRRRPLESFTELVDAELVGS